MTAGTSITLRGVRKVWGETVSLSGIDLDIPAGQFTTILGPSGCGKSTTLRVIAGLEDVTEGSVHIGQDDVTRVPPAARDIAMVFQSYALFPHLSVAENIVFGLRVRRLGRAAREAKLREAADLLGLTALLDRKPGELSGGQQQRVALGRAIVADKSIFLMDEPLSNLDAKLRAEMREEIRALQKRLGVTMVYVTHDQVEAVTMADQVVLMHRGQIEQVAPPRQIYARPETLFAARFIGTPPMSLFSPAALGVDHSPVVCGIRPEALMLSDQGPLGGTVTHVEYLGADAMIEAQVGADRVLSRAPGMTTLSAGDTVRFAFAPGDLHVFDRQSERRLDRLPPEIETRLAAHTPAPLGALPN